jgi:hypothetical protein
MYVPVAEPLTSQPQEAVQIDWANPLTAGLVGWINPATLQTASFGGGGLFDPFSAIRSRPLGRAHVGDGLALHHVRLLRPLSNRGATLFALCNIRAIGGGTGFTAAFGTSVPGSAIGMGIQQGLAGNNKPRGFLRPVEGMSISSVEITGSNSVGADILDVALYALRYDGASSFRVFRDGVDVTASNDLLGASGGFTGMDLLCLGMQRDPAHAPNPPAGSGEQLCYGVWGWDRALSDDEIRAVSLNPWQVYLSSVRTRHPLSRRRSVTPYVRRQRYEAPLTSQPQEVVEIDWGNPLAENLLWASVGGSTHNLVAQRGPIQVQGSLRQGAPTRLGVGLEFTGTQYVRGAEFGAPRDDRKFTGVAVVTRDAAGTYGTVIGAFPGAGGTGQCYMSIYAGGQISVATFDGTWRESLSFASSAPAGASGVFVGRWRGAAGVDGFWNGWRTDNPETAALGTLAPREFQMGSWNAGGDAFWRGTLHAAFWWDRELSDAEVQSISANPWQLFRSPRALFGPPNPGVIPAPMTLTMDDAHDAAMRGRWNESLSVVESWTPVVVREGDDAIVICAGVEWVSMLTLNGRNLLTPEHELVARIDGNVTKVHMYEVRGLAPGIYELYARGVYSWGITVHNIRGLPSSDHRRQVTFNDNYTSGTKTTTLTTEPGDLIIAALTTDGPITVTDGIQTSNRAVIDTRCMATAYKVATGTSTPITFTHGAGQSVAGFIVYKRKPSLLHVPRLVLTDAGWTPDGGEIAALRGADGLGISTATPGASLRVLLGE